MARNRHETNQYTATGQHTTPHYLVSKLFSFFNNFQAQLTSPPICLLPPPLPCLLGRVRSSKVRVHHLLKSHGEWYRITEAQRERRGPPGGPHGRLGARGPRRGGGGGGGAAGDGGGEGRGLATAGYRPHALKTREGRSVRLTEHER